MFGGEVIGVTRVDGIHLLHVHDHHECNNPCDGTKCTRDKCVESEHAILLGDLVWWDRHFVYWTPAREGSASNRVDIRLKIVKRIIRNN